VDVEEFRLADGSLEAYVTLPGGRSLSAELVRAGLAWPSAERVSRLASSLAVLEMRAMADRRGVWAGPGTPPAALQAAREGQGSTSLGVEQPAADADAGDVEETRVTENPAAVETGVRASGEN